MRVSVVEFGGSGGSRYDETNLDYHCTLIPSLIRLAVDSGEMYMRICMYMYMSCPLTLRTLQSVLLMIVVCPDE